MIFFCFAALIVVVVTKAQEVFDVIVVGGGSAGAVVAARLAEVESISVLVLEAGGATHPCTGGPVILTCPYEDACMDGPNAEYGLVDVPMFSAIVGNRADWWWQSRFPRGTGRGWGGTGALNGLLFLRGKPSDFDAITAMGLQGWDWPTVLEYYKKSEKYQGKYPNSTEHSADGWIGVTDQPEDASIRILLDSAIAAGYKEIDINGADKDGFGNTPRSVFNGKRTTSLDLLCPAARAHPNLVMRDLAEVTQVLLEQRDDGEGLVAVGVRYLDARTGTSVDVFASSAVVLSGGNIGTAYILLKSGVGPREELDRVGIPLVLDVPGVGRNNRDDVYFTINYDYRIVREPPREPSENPSTLYRWLTTGGGYYGTPAGWHKGTGESGFIARESNGAFDIMFRRGGISGNVGVAISPPTFNNCVVSTTGAQTHWCNWTMKEDLSGLSSICCSLNDVDVEDAAHAIEVFRTIAAQEPFASFAVETGPGPDVVTREQLREWVRARMGSYNHGMGTCRMGLPEDPMAVVDEQLKFSKGIDRLWIVDNSVFPVKLSQEAWSSGVLVGERGADFIIRHFGWSTTTTRK